VLVFLSFINCCSVNWTNRVQYVFTIAKVLALIIIIVIGIIELTRGVQLLLLSFPCLEGLLSSLLLLSVLRLCRIIIFVIVNTSGILLSHLYIFYVVSCTGEFFNFENAFANVSHNPGAIALSFYSGLFSYSGW